MTQTVEEIIARAIALSQGGKMTGPSRHRASDEFPWEPDNGHMAKYVEKHWQDTTHAAQFAIEALTAAGFAIVPVEPTNEVLAAMYEAMFDDKWNGTQAPMVGAGWDAGIKAASPGYQTDALKGKWDEAVSQDRGQRDRISVSGG